MMSKKQFDVAIIGATGIVGRELLSILHERSFPISKVYALASSKSAGQELEFGDDKLIVQELSPTTFPKVDIAFFAASNDIAKQYCPIAVQKGAVCIDKSSVHRMLGEVPLVVPEVNPQDIEHFRKKGIIASPNCTVTPVVQALSPLKEFGIKRVVACSYQAVSGAGQAGVDELQAQVQNLFNFRDLSTDVFKKRIAFNVLPCIPAQNGFLDDGSTSEEQKMIDEAQKIMHMPGLAMAVTCARVPVFNGHSIAIHAEFEKALSANDARDLLAKAPGIIVIDNPSKGLYPTAVDASGEDVTLVGRIRDDKSVPHGLSLWVSSDNLRTGAALNAVKIAEILCREYLA